MKKVYVLVHYCLVKDHEKVDCFGINEVKPLYSLLEVLKELHSIYSEVEYPEETITDTEIETTAELRYAYDNVYPIVSIIRKNDRGFCREDRYEIHEVPAERIES